jgi:apolipoprotein N-acyltransferase
VPFGEYAPRWVPGALQLVPGGGFASGPGPRTLHVPGLPPVGILICYEAIFPSQVVDEADRPDWIVNVTNDAWFGNSAGPRQHLAAARMRAVEEGLPLLRAANTGISAAFDARGHELARLGMQQTGFLPVRLPAAIALPFYPRVGLWLPCGAAMLLIIVSIAARITRQRGNRPNIYTV